MITRTDSVSDVLPAQVDAATLETIEIARAFQSPLLMADRFSRGEYQVARHLAVIDYEFRSLLARDDLDILIVSAPVRHGKSQYLAKWAPAWYMLRNPYANVITTSHTASLANSNSLWVRDKVHELAPLLGLRGVNPNKSARSNWGWDLGGGGECKAAGVGTAIAGFSANLLIVDDYMKDAQSAYSQRVRDRQWDWFMSVATTRLEPGGKVALLCCLTGETLVSMADGSHRALRDVRVGDMVKTFDAGSLGVSRVVNHASLGLDEVFRIRLASGNTVTGNARHPFLVESNGELQWVRLKNLSTGQKILTCVDRMSASSAASMAVRSRPTRCKGAGITTTRRGATGLIWASRVGARCVALRANGKAAIRRLSVAASVPSTTVKRGGSMGTEGCSAIVAIWQPDTLYPVPPPIASLNTSQFTSDAIVAIEPIGRAEVFDLEVAETGSFIANGLVSHNTRWHEDDLIGRLLERRSEIGLRVRSVTMPAIKEDDGRRDPCGRKPGEALWPERWPADVLARRQKASSIWWSALYQGRPASEGGSEWPKAYFSNVWVSEDDWPADWPLLSASYLDPSKAKNDKKDDYQALVYVGYHKGCLYVDSWIDRVSVPQMLKQWIAFNRERRPKLAGVEGNAFQELLAGQYFAACTEHGYAVDHPEVVINSIAKIVRIRRLGWWLSKGLLRFRRTASNELLIRMLKDFPNAEKDDGPDSLEGAIRLMLQLLDPEMQKAVTESTV